jgi:hypothetical protein
MQQEMGVMRMQQPMGTEHDVMERMGMQPGNMGGSAMMQRFMRGVRGVEQMNDMGMQQRMMAIGMRQPMGGMAIGPDVMGSMEMETRMQWQMRGMGMQPEMRVMGMQQPMGAEYDVMGRMGMQPGGMGGSAMMPQFMRGVGGMEQMNDMGMQQRTRDIGMQQNQQQQVETMRMQLQLGVQVHTDTHTPTHR